MHMALRSFLATAAAGLALAPAAVADTATQDLYLARDACGGTAPANTRLDTGLGASTLGCGSTVGGVISSTTSYPAVAGAMPVTLDATRPIYVAISIDSYLGVAVGGIGDETVSVTLSGRNADNKTVTLGSASQTTPAQSELRNPHYVAEFNLPLKPDQGGLYNGITLSLTVGGAELGGYVNHDGSSLVMLPIPGNADDGT
jgi:hypothetical protein